MEKKKVHSTSSASTNTSTATTPSSERRADWVSSIVEEVRLEGEKSDRRLRELGYRNDFRRDMAPLGVLGLSFCAVGILTGMSSAFQTALFSGGPLGLFWGWNVRMRIHSVLAETSVSSESERRDDSSGG